MAKAKKTDNALFDALKAVAIASNENGLVSERFARINEREIVSSDGVIAIGHKVELGFVAFPNLKQMLTAMKSCGDKPAEITHSGDIITVKAGRFRAAIQTMPAENVHPIAPDPARIEIPGAVREGLVFCGELIEEGSVHVMTASVLLSSGICKSTDRATFREFWHGVNLPDFTVPRHCINALAKLKDAPTRLGWTDSTITFHYDDGTWIKSHLHSQNWPVIGKDLFGDCSMVAPIPDEFFEAVEAVAAFNPDSVVIDEHTVSTPSGNATFDVGLSVPFDLSPEKLLAVKKYATHYRQGPNGAFVWTGENKRGVIALKYRGS